MERECLSDLFLIVVQSKRCIYLRHIRTCAHVHQVSSHRDERVKQKSPLLPPPPPSSPIIFSPRSYSPPLSSRHPSGEAAVASTASVRPKLSRGGWARWGELRVGIWFPSPTTPSTGGVGEWLELRCTLLGSGGRFARDRPTTLLRQDDGTASPPRSFTAVASGPLS